MSPVIVGVMFWMLSLILFSAAHKAEAGFMIVAGALPSLFGVSAYMVQNTFNKDERSK